MKCEWCGGAWSSNYPWQRFCSVPCRNKSYREQHRELLNARDRARSYDPIKKKAYHARTKQRQAAWRKEYYQRRREELLAYGKRWRKKNKKVVRLYRRQHLAEDAFRASQRRALMKVHSLGDFTLAAWKELKLAYRGRCAYCDRRRKLTIDHVIPLAKGGAHTLSNIVPACKSCNCKKAIGPAPAFQPPLFHIIQGGKDVS